MAFDRKSLTHCHRDAAGDSAFRRPEYPTRSHILMLRRTCTHGKVPVDLTKLHRAGTSFQMGGNSDGLQGGVYENGSEQTDHSFAFFGDNDSDRDADDQDDARFARRLMNRL